MGDPAGNQMAQTNETTPFMILRAAGINAYPCNTNDISLRIESVEGVLNRMSEGLPSMVISPTCVTLINGLKVAISISVPITWVTRSMMRNLIKIALVTFMTPFSTL